MSERIRAAYLTVHPAPYHNPALTLVHQRGLIDLEVRFLFPYCDWHPYWGLDGEPFPVRPFPRGQIGSYFHCDLLAPYELHQARYDVVCISGYQYPTLQLALAYCLATTTPFVWIGDSILGLPRSRLRLLLKQLPMQLIARRMGAAWVPGRAGQAYMQSYGARSEQIFEGAYCLDAEELIARTQGREPQRAEIRRRLGFGAEQTILLFVGRMIPSRGIAHLLQAYAHLAAGHPELALLLVGRGEVRPWAEEFIRQHGLAQARIVDPVPFNDLVDYYVACDAYVHPSVQEPYSLATAQGAISGRPLVVSDRVGAAWDYLIEGQTGFAAQAGSSDALADAIARLIADKARMITMGRCAQDVARRRTSAWAASQLEAAITTAAQQRGK